MICKQTGIMARVPDDWFREYFKTGKFEVTQGDFRFVLKIPLKGRF